MKATEESTKKINTLRFGIGPVPKELKKIAEEVLIYPRELQSRAKIRFQHFNAKDTGRLVGTIATRELPDGTIDVAASIVNKNQGRRADDREREAAQLLGLPLADLKEVLQLAQMKKGSTEPKRKRELPETRMTGKKLALLRLMSGNQDGIRITSSDALYLLEKGPHTEIRGAHMSPADICVVNFSKEELAHAISTRGILRFFPGQQWVPPLREQRPLKPRKAKSAQPQPTRTLMQRFMAVFH